MRLPGALWVALSLVLAGCAGPQMGPQSDTPPPGWTASNVELLGYTLMNEHPAFKITMTRAADRYYIVGGHYNIPGWSVVDVTDPRNPHVAKFIPGPPNTSTNQVDLSDNIVVAALGRPNAREDAGMDAKKPHSAGVMLIDMKDPLNPKELGRWLTDKPEGRGTLSYGDAGMVVLDISDVSKPKLVSQTHFVRGHRFDVHTVLPDFKRKLVYVNSEAVTYDCKGPLNHATIVDVADPHHPVPLSRFPVPIPEAGLPYTSFCEKGGRFGPHNQNQLQYNPNVQKQGNLSYLTWFNGGLRIYDVTNKRAPREVGYFMAGPPPKQYLKAYGPYVRMEDVFVDDRGYIYVTGGAQQGLYVLRYTGPVKN